jgi:hypothetical protein
MWLKYADLFGESSVFMGNLQFSRIVYFVLVKKLCALKEDLWMWNTNVFGTVGVKKTGVLDAIPLSYVTLPT